MDTPPSSQLLADRRWLIGIGVTVAFGIFGAVMAWLSYSGRQGAPGQLAAPTVTAAPPAPAPAPAPKGRGKGRGND